MIVHRWQYRHKKSDDDNDNDDNRVRISRMDRQEIGETVGGSEVGVPPPLPPQIGKFGKN